MTNMLWAAAVGQTIFIVIWSTRPWWRLWIGRALMAKSAALVLVLWFWVVGFYAPEYTYRDEVRSALIFAVTVGIWLQVVVVVVEFYGEHLSRAFGWVKERLSGTGRNDGTPNP